MAVCYLGLGANLGDRAKNIRLAFDKIDQLTGTRVTKVSSLIETDPVGGPVPQRRFLNAAARITTSLPPLALLRGLQQIEQELGRVRSARNGPRVIDIDILLYSDRIIRSRELSVPHPRMFERSFVMRPLSEVL